MESGTYKEVLLRASSLLTKNELNPKIAEWLMLHLLQLNRTDFYGILDQLISDAHEKTFSKWIERVTNEEPYQYIIGTEEFYGRTFSVNPAVLIPRPETELLVEYVLQFIHKIWPTQQRIKGADVGTGSGIIAITLTLESPSLEMIATDISENALEVAQHNARRHDVNARFLKSDLLQAVKDAQEKVDLIVSNPPYIPGIEKNRLDRNVLDFEPHIALFAEEDGLFFYRRIIEQSIGTLQLPGLIAFEIGVGQAQPVRDLIENYYPQAECIIKKDLQGIDRMVFAVIN